MIETYFKIFIRISLPYTAGYTTDFGEYYDLSQIQLIIAGSVWEYVASMPSALSVFQKESIGEYSYEIGVGTSSIISLIGIVATEENIQLQQLKQYRRLYGGIQ